MEAQIDRGLGIALLFGGNKVAMIHARDLPCGSDNIMGYIFQK